MRSTVINAGTLEVMQTQGSGADLISNGGFESGTGFPFSNIDEWFNFGGSQDLNGRNQSNSFSGIHRGIVGRSSSGLAVSPAQATGVAVQNKAVYQLSFRYAAAGSWDIGTDQMDVVVYQEGPELFRQTLTPSIHFGDGYNAFLTQLPSFGPSAVGQPILVRFESLASNGEFASIDEVSLTPLNSNEIAHIEIDGDYHQLSTGQMCMTIGNPDGKPGEDYDRVNITGRANLDGDLNVEFEKGYQPELGDLFEIVSANLVAGEFATVQIPDSPGIIWEVVYTTSSVFVVAFENTVLLGDLNLDGVVNLLDVAPFVSLIIANDFQMEGDINGDGLVNLLDVEPFIDLLAG